jgi:hypothetical protein
VRRPHEKLAQIVHPSINGISSTSKLISIMFALAPPEKNLSLYPVGDGQEEVVR